MPSKMLTTFSLSNIFVPTFDLDELMSTSDPKQKKNRCRLKKIDSYLSTSAQCL